VGTATTIGVGPSNDVWITGTSSPDSGGWSVYELTNNNSTWLGPVGPAGTAGTQIAVDDSGTPWLINDLVGGHAQGSLFKWNGSSFIQFGPTGTCARSVAIDPSENPWVIACSQTQDPGGANFDIQHWNGSTWGPPLPREFGTQIATSPAGVPWVINSNNDIFEWNGSIFAGPFGPSGSKAQSIAIGPDGNPWVVGLSSGFDAAKGNDVFHWNGSSWDGPFGAATQIAVSSEQIPGSPYSFGTPWIVDKTFAVSELVYPAISVSVTEWATGPEIFINGSGFPVGSAPNSNAISITYYGIPEAPGAHNGDIGPTAVGAGGTFEVDDTEFDAYGNTWFEQCTAAQANGIVTIVATAAQTGTTALATVPASDWCSNYE